MCYDFLMLTDVLKIVLRQHVYRGFYDKMPSFFAVFLRIWSICCMLSRQINLNNMEKEEPIIRRVYRKSLNYGATVVSVVSYAFVTVVPPRMSRSFHGHCHTRSMVMERPCPPRWNKCVNTCCHNCSKENRNLRILSHPYQWLCRMISGYHWQRLLCRTPNRP